MPVRSLLPWAAGVGADLEMDSWCGTGGVGGLEGFHLGPVRGCLIERREKWGACLVQTWARCSVTDLQGSLSGFFTTRTTSTTTP